MRRFWCAALRCAGQHHVQTLVTSKQTRQYIYASSVCALYVWQCYSESRVKVIVVAACQAAICVDIVNNLAALVTTTITALIAGFAVIEAVPASIMGGQPLSGH